MDKENRLREESHRLTKAVLEGMEESHLDFIKSIRLVLNKRPEELADIILECITYIIIESGADEDFADECIFYLEALKFSKRSKSPWKIWLDDGLRLYCYAIQGIAYETVEMVYTGGVSYKEFIHKVLKKNHLAQKEYRKYIGNTGEKIFYENEEQEELLAGSWKKDVSDRRQSQGDFIEQIKSHRTTHGEVKDKNQNGGQYIFPAIADYEIAANEFDFYFKKWNKSKNSDDKLLDEIRKISYKKLEKYFKKDTENYLKMYREIQKKDIRERNEKDAGILIEIAKKKIQFILEEELDAYKHMAVWAVLRKLDYNIFQQSQLFPDLVLYYFPSMADAFIACIGLICDEENQADQIKKLMDATIKAGNRASQIINYDQDMYPEMESSVLLKIWKSEPRFDEKKIIDRLKIKFLAPLKNDDIGMDRFLTLVFLLCDVECTDIKIEVLERALKVIFEFLKECKQKSDKILDETSLNVRDELKKMGTELGKLGVNISMDTFENSYVGNNIKRYFGKRYEIRYNDIIQIIKETSCTGDFRGQQVLKKYLNSILKTNIDRWSKLRRNEQEWDLKFCRDLYSMIHVFLYPGEIEREDRSKKKQIVFDFAQEYDFKNYIGFKKPVEKRS